MIDRALLRNLVLEVLGKTPQTQLTDITNGVERLVRERDLFPTKEECQQLDVDYDRYYGQRSLTRNDGETVTEIVWDLIVERVLSPGAANSDASFPHVRLTPFGQEFVTQAAPHYYQDSYVECVKSLTQDLDPVIEQYLSEAVRCFRGNLLFGAAVMAGAAAEKATLLLLSAICKWTSDPQEKQKCEQLLDKGRLPAIFDKITDTLTALTKSGGPIPYTVHQGCIEHLFSLFEMIRVQRNDAVHPACATVDRTKVFRSLQTMPVALQVVYRLIKWFEES